MVKARIADSEKRLVKDYYIISRRIQMDMESTIKKISKIAKSACKSFRNMIIYLSRENNIR